MGLINPTQVQRNRDAQILTGISICFTQNFTVMLQAQKFLNTQEVSQLLKCTQKNIQRLIRERKLIPINPYHTNGYLFESSYINELIMAKEGHKQNV